MRKLSDEAHGVRHQRVPAEGQLESTSRGIERGEELVLHQDIRIGEIAKQRRLPRVRVADQCNNRNPRVGTALTLESPSTFERDQILLDPLNATENRPALGLQRGLSGAPRADAATQAGEHIAPAAQAGQAIVQLCQLDLQLPLRTACVLSEDVENQAGAVDNLETSLGEGVHTGDVLEVATLRGRQFVVEDDHVGIERACYPGDLLRLALPQIGRGIGGLTPLHRALYRVCACRIGKRL